MTSLQEYMTITEQSLEQLRAMIELEQEKRKALLDQNIDTLESVLQKQQAMLMQTDQLERKRLTSQKEAGYEGLTARQIEVKLPQSEESQQLIALFADLRAAAEELKSLNKIAIDIAQVNLRIIENVTRAGNEDGLYKAGGQKNSRTIGRAFEEQI